MQTPYEVITDHRHLLGESPVWNKETDCLYWADLLDKKIYCYNENSKDIQHWQFEETVGSFALANQNQLLIALRSGIYLFSMATQQLQHVVTPEHEPYPNTRFNDGKVGPDGCFYVGTMDETFQSSIGKLYRITPQGQAEKIKDGFMVSNGLAWTQDGKTMIHSCSELRKIWCYDFDVDTGKMTNERVLASPSDEIGKPDGGAYDTQGGYWSAGVSSGFLNRYLADGTLDQHIALPMEAPTMPCFGGKNNNRIFLTSLSRNRSSANFENCPLSGAVIAIDSDFQGVEIPKFNSDANAV